MNTLQRLVKTARLISQRCCAPFTASYSINIFEPDYLEALKPKVPLYEPLNIEIRGYDYPLLESYQRLIHNIAKNMDINVEDSWALPHQDLNVTTYKPNSEIVDSQFQLKIFRRTVQVTDVPSTQLPILIRAIEASTPTRVTVNITQHTEQHEEERYIPDKELMDLKQTLESMEDSKKK